MLGELIRNPRPLRIGDVGSHPYSYGFPVGHPPMGSFLGVPIVVEGEPHGHLYLAIDHAQRYTGSEFSSWSLSAVARSCRRAC